MFYFGSWYQEIQRCINGNHTDTLQWTIIIYKYNIVFVWGTELSLYVQVPDVPTDKFFFSIKCIYFSIVDI